MAPEIIVDMLSTTKVDMWALGVILYQLTFNKLPFEAPNSYDLMKLIRESEPNIPSTVYPFIKEIIL